MAALIGSDGRGAPEAQAAPAGGSRLFWLDEGELVPAGAEEDDDRRPWMEASGDWLAARNARLQAEGSQEVRGAGGPGDDDALTSLSWL